MRFLKPKFWDEKKLSLFSIILLPISIIIQIVIFLKENFIERRYFDVPIICIGNIYLGGTGKTPLSIEISKILKKNKKKPAVIKKFHSNQKDEMNLIKNKSKSLIVNKNRISALNDAQLKGFDTMILDDGLQDSSIKADLNIVCFNGNTVDGNGLTIPSGPLRENLKRLINCEIVAININNKDKKNLGFEKKIRKINNSLDIFYTKYFFHRPSIKKIKNKKIFAFAGIGNPERFFNLLKSYNLKIQKEKYFPDHYEYSINELKEMIEYSKKNKLELITTEKDFYRIKKFGLKKINFIPTDFKIEDEKRFVKILKRYI
tara:strand:- start:504 stop:1454 length:951 start_codon:yes stop_codon:yes gene_type:complete